MRGMRLDAVRQFRRLCVALRIVYARVAQYTALRAVSLHDFVVRLSVSRCAQRRIVQTFSLDHPLLDAPLRSLQAQRCSQDRSLLNANVRLSWCLRLYTRKKTWMIEEELATRGVGRQKNWSAQLPEVNQSPFGTGVIGSRFLSWVSGNDVASLDTLKMNGIGKRCQDTNAILIKQTRRSRTHPRI